VRDEDAIIWELTQDNAFPFEESVNINAFWQYVMAELVRMRFVMESILRKFSNGREIIEQALRHYSLDEITSADFDITNTYEQILAWVSSEK
jgi:hypothetical protein